MSAFSYISFPREVDTSCLISKVDKSKMFTVAEIRGTEFDSGNLDALPDSTNVYLGDILTDFQGMRVFENKDASFIGVFANRFIYCLEAAFELLDAEKYIQECMRIYYEEAASNGGTTIEEHMNFAYSMIKYNKDNVAICRKQLHELVQVNTYHNEMVEIYTEWISGATAELGPANERIALDLSQILESELLSLKDKQKIEIIHT